MSLSTLSKPLFSPFSLQDLTLYAVARSLVEKSIQLKPTPETIVQDCHLLQNIVGVIPVTLANEFMRVVIDILKRINRPDCLPLVSHRTCDSFVFSSEGDTLVPEIVGNIGSMTGVKTLKFQDEKGRRKKHLVSLREVSDYRNLSKLAVAIRALSNLTTIHLPNICTTEILRSIGSSCSSLVDLNIHKSIRIDIDSVSNLTKCKKLKFLNVDCIRSAMELAPYVANLLRNLPDLRSLWNFDILSVMDVLLRNTDEIVGVNYKLETAFLGFRRTTIDLISLRILFPNLKKIDVSEITLDSDIWFLRNFSKLTSLAIGEDNEYVLPFLTEAAAEFQCLNLSVIENASGLFQRCNFMKLSSLELLLCSELDLELVNKSAPRLRSFTMNDCTTVRRSSFENNRGFANLDSLTISRTNFTTAEILFLFRSSDELSELNLDSVYIRFPFGDEHISDVVFSKCVDYLRKKCLKTVTLSNLGSTCKIVQYLVQNFQAITYIETNGDQADLSDEEDLAVRLSIVNSLKCYTKRNITLRMWGMKPLMSRNLIENDPAAMKTLDHLIPRNSRRVRHTRRRARTR